MNKFLTSACKYFTVCTLSNSVCPKRAHEVLRRPKSGHGCWVSQNPFTLHAILYPALFNINLTCQFRRTSNFCKPKSKSKHLLLLHVNRCTMNGVLVELFEGQYYQKLERNIQYNLAGIFLQNSPHRKSDRVA